MLTIWHKIHIKPAVNLKEEKMSWVLKSSLLAICSILPSTLANIILLAMPIGRAPYHESELVFIGVLFGMTFCLIFRTPFLLLIDKYFSQLRFRYMIGRTVAVMTGAFVIYPFVIYPFGMDNLAGFWFFGFLTGLLYTLMLRAIDYYKSNRRPSL